MEEASVAGESPDRSKQRESSAEPTSGSAGPVPEARTESPEPPEKRDPRLAVARESAGASSTARGGVDTATRVFSVRELAAEPERADEAAPDAAEAGSAQESAPDAGKAKDTDGTAPDAGEPEADAGKPETGKPEAGKAATEAEESAPDAGEPEADAGKGATEAEEGAQGAVEPQAGDSDAEKAAEAVQGDVEARTAEEGAQDAGKPEAASADSKTGQDAAESPAGATKSHTGQGAQDVAEPEAGAGDTQAEGTDTEAASGAVDEPDDRGESGTTGNARLRDAVAAWVASADEKADEEKTEAGDAEDTAGAEDREPAQDGSEADAEANTDADQASDADTDADVPAAERTDHGTDADADADARTEDDPDTGAVESAPEADADADAEAEAEAEAGTGTGTDTPKPTASADAKASDAPAAADEATRDAKPPVDQPTAVFKAPRPSAPPVDQPTTMLKLGDAAKAPKDAPEAEGDKAEGGSEPESPAERTSKFVALKPLDDPATRKPKPADATTALPQATPAPKAKPPADAPSSVPQAGPERTTQQPLPPRPPLDLLAELTNTPPPPETPVRTIVRRVKIWTPLVLLLAVVFAIVQAVRPLPAPALTLTAEESYTFEGSKADLPWPSEGQGWMDVNGIGTMGDFGKQTPVAIGSVAKAMTAYIVLKDHPLKSGAEGPNIPVDATAEKEGGYDKDGESTLNTVKEGDNLTLRQAITAIMIPSANNVARLLARWDADTEAAFIKKMNDAAKDLGMKNTTYTDASGLKETTVSTAEDQVKLGNELVKMPALMEITSMGQWIDPSGQKWYNYNYLVPYNGAIGIKTGTTTAAGGNLLFAARKEVGGETVTLVGAILGQHKAPIIQTVNDVSRTAMLAAQDEMTSAKILKKGDVVGYVDDGLGGQTPVVVTKDVTAVGWAGFKVKLSFAPDDVPHSAKAGTKVGSLTVGDGASGAVKVPVALQKDLVEPGYPDKLTRLG
ncbi:hypothetical protein ADK57_01770 [Streptomyces sp. MMG1533]|uniref:hypothetical protein n=1 Tax=Streptomyces sp. MMG1533 TaxID=1415546 RepID=UPI0006C4CE50|nr:hypothetical protein [Streptomyces sp. MMG1533]KOU77621.1 hypothetical protein ADK57_01770 [Streptomyces sp. MMG1533]